MKTLPIKIREKIAVYDSDEKVVCHNSDYLLKFDFDAEWTEYKYKTAIVRYFKAPEGWLKHEIVFEGETCELPVIDKAAELYIGVFAGDIRTTTEAKIPCRLSALSMAGVPVDPPDNVYNQILKMLEELKAGEVSPEDIKAAVDKYFEDNPIEPSEIGAVSADQGAENADRILGIGEDGKVIPVDKPQGDVKTVAGVKPDASGNVPLTASDVGASPGVYCGSDEPSEEYDVWIDPNGNESEWLTVYATPEMYGAKGDGVTDDTEAIQAAIDSGLPVKLAPKTYAITGLVLTQNTVIDGNGSTLFASGLQYSTVGKTIIRTERDANNTIDISIKNLNVTQSAHVAYMAFFYYASSLIMENCIFDGKGWVNGVVDEEGATNIAQVYYSKNITVKNSVFTGATKGKGLEFRYCEDGLVCDNEFSWTGRGGFSLLDNNTRFTVQNNKILQAVRNFAVADGALDLYGPDNTYVNIVGNFIYGFGNAQRSCCGCRIKGSQNVLFSGNRIETDAETNCFAHLIIQDRSGVGNDNILVSDNYFVAKEAIVVSYVIRIDNGDVAADNIVISNNIIDSDITVNEDISIRRTVKNLSIVGNRLKNIGFYPALYELGMYSDVIVEGNICTGIYVHYVDTINISNNIVKSDDDGEPIVVNNSKGITINGNIVKCPNAKDWYTTSNNERLLIGTDNAFETLSGKGNTEFDFLATTKYGSEIEFEAIDGKPIFISVFGKTEMESEEIPTLDNLVDYASTNENQLLETTVSQKGNTIATLPDTVAKFALPVYDSGLANYIGDDGRMWYSDYRDWSNGVDVHLVEEKVFDGTETTWDVIVTDSGTKVFRYYFFADRRAHSIGSGAPYQYGMEMVLANFDKYTYSESGVRGNIQILNSQGTGIAIRGITLELDEFKSYVAQQYANGTPLKVLYPLAKSYTTPIPESELSAYKNMPSLSGNTTVTVNEGAYASVTAYTDDKYTDAIEKLIDYKVRAAMRAEN